MDHIQYIAHNIFETLIIKAQVQDYHGDRFLDRSGTIVAAHEKVHRTRRELRPLEPVRPSTTRCGAAVPFRQVTCMSTKVALPLSLRKMGKARHERAAPFTSGRALRPEVHESQRMLLCSPLRERSHRE